MYNIIKDEGMGAHLSVFEVGRKGTQKSSGGRAVRDGLCGLVVFLSTGTSREATNTVRVVSQRSYFS